MYLSKASSSRTALEHLFLVNLSVCLPSSLFLFCVRSCRLVVSALVLVDPLSTLCLVSYHNHFCFPYHLILDDNPNLAAATLATADVIAQNKDRKTPLHLTSEQGQVDIAHMLIEHGADLTAQTYGGETPLHLASRH